METRELEYESTADLFQEIGLRSECAMLVRIPNVKNPGIDFEAIMSKNTRSNNKIEDLGIILEDIAYQLLEGDLKE